MPKFMDFHDDLKLPQDAIDQIAQGTRDGVADEFGVRQVELFHNADGIFHHAGTEGRVAGPAPEHADYGSFVAFSDPDGNGWLLQEIKTRLPGR